MLGWQTVSSIKYHVLGIKKSSARDARSRWQRYKDKSKARASSRLRSARTQSRWATAVPDVVKPAPAPDPPVTVPAKTPHTRDAAPVAVDRPPEEDVFAFPPLGDEVRVCEQVVEDVGVQERLVLELLVELVAFDHPAVLLRFGEPELDLVGTPGELAALMVLLNATAVRDERVCVAINDVHHLFLLAYMR